MFVGREKELAALGRRYESGRFEFVPVYGRRRVGKTTLLKEFCKGRSCVYYTATSGTLEYNMSRLASLLFGADVKASIDTVLDRIKVLSSEERFVLVIDEYPRLIEKAPEFQDRLQELIDEIQDDSKLFLILCGSSVNIMEHEVLGIKSPLYGRRTGSLELKPMDLWTSMELLEGFSREDALRIYGIAGGIPLYLRQFDSSIPMRENMISCFLEEDSFFANEHVLTLMEEFENPATYYTIVEAVATGHAKVSEVASYAGLEGSVATNHLKTLVDIGILARDKPVDNPDGRKTRYRVADPFMRFQMGRVLPARNSNRDPSEIAEDLLKSLDRDMGRVFEEMCAEYLVERFGGTAGRWWGPDPKTRTQEEIDLVITLGRGEGVFVECKYRSEPVDRSVYDTLVRRSLLVKGYEKRMYALASKSGFADDIPRDGSVLLLTLDDIMERPGR